MRMNNEKEVVFIHNGLEFRRCEVTECMWNVDYNLLKESQEMLGHRPVPQKFLGNICDCDPELSVGLEYALKVNCFITKETALELSKRYKVSL